LDIIQQIINGLSLGSVYALIAVGYSLVYSILLFSNFAHGGFLVIGGYICYYALTVMGAGIWTAAFAAVLGAGISAILVERFAYRPIRERTPVTLYLLIASMGMSIVIENLFVVTIGGRFRALPPVLPMNPVSVFGIATTSAFDILSLVVAIVFLVALQLFLDKTRWGLAIRAASYNLRTASLMGVNVNRLIAIVFFAAGLFAAVGGIFLSARYTLYPQLGSTITTKAFDESYSRNVTMGDLDEAKFEDYIRLVQEAGKVSFRKGITPREVLVKLNALSERTDKIVNGALPLFAKRPERVKPSWELRCLQFWGTEVTKPLPALHTYHGTVFELVDQALEFVMSHVDFWVGAPISKTSGAAPTKSELPPDAVREAIVNAVCHRDYTDNGCVQVMVFRDRVEIINPGSLPKGWTVEKLLKTHDSKPRNEVIAKAMSWTSYVERSGSGTGDIVQKCREWGLPEPTYKPDAVDFKTIIWRKSSNVTPVKDVSPVNMKGVDGLTPFKMKGVEGATPVGVMTVNRFEQIMLALREGPLSTIELSQKIGVPDVKNVQRRYAKTLLGDGLIEYTIPDKPNSRLQKYRLTAKGNGLLEDILGRAIKR